ncbi:MAG: hypothetical protein SGJ27_14535 [Candidatus Melainabacteria bacterium]|nr:hypothetical protein [Candidatus Melainabacteria bacterium]
MKEVKPDSSFATAVNDDELAEAINLNEKTVSFAPDSEVEIEQEHEVNAEISDTECDDIDIEDIQIDNVETRSHADLNDVSGPTDFIDDEIEEHDPIDTEETDTIYGDSDWDAGEGPVLVYDVPRPALTIDEAAAILGKSIGAIERGISGRWGNRLPDGWKARKMKIDGQDEWRIIPPPNFVVRHSKSRKPRTEDMTSKTSEKPATARATTSSPRTAGARNEEATGLLDNDSLFGFSINSLLQTAGKRAKTELAKAAEHAIDATMEYPTIVIDRSDDVELLLRELAEARKELNDERRMHIEDLRVMADMQSSMRLLESKSSQTAILKDELLEVTKTLQEHRRQYQEFLALPWWARLFRKSP